jgi:uncharacterized Zn finger protein
MQFNLDNFDIETDPVIAERGQDYYFAHAVTEAVEYPPGHWTAHVEGSEDYTVTIDLQGNEIIDWDCDCPYEHGLVCKHVVAVLHYVKDMTKGTEAASSTTNSPKKSLKQSPLETVTTLLSRVTDNELRDFILQQLQSDESFRSSFLIAFSHKDLSKAADERYREIINRIALKASDRSGFIDYYHADEFIDPVLSLLDNASKLLAMGNVDETFSIVSAVMEKTPEVAMEMDDSAGGIMMIWDNSLEMVYQMIEKAPPPFKDKLFDYYMSQLPLQRYSNIGFDDSLLRLQAHLASTKEQEKRLFELIDQRTKAKESEYNISSLLKIKINFFEKRGRSSEAWEIVTSNLHIDEFRMKLIDRLIIEKQYDEARRFCQEGITLIKNKGYAWSSDSQYKEKLLEIAQKESNVNEILALAEDLFFSTHYQMGYFILLKKDWPEGSWEEKREGVIDRIKGPDATGSFQNAYALANIFTEEKLTDRLLKLLQINWTSIGFVDEFAKNVAEDHPAEVVEMYRQSILKYAEATGRPVYNETVRYLKKLKALEGGKPIAVQLVAHFRLVYKNRRAMMEILNKHF